MQISKELRQTLQKLPPYGPFSSQLPNPPSSSKPPKKSRSKPSSKPTLVPKPPSSLPTKSNDPSSLDDDKLISFSLKKRTLSTLQTSSPSLPPSKKLCLFKASQTSHSPHPHPHSPPSLTQKKRKFIKASEKKLRKDTKPTFDEDLPPIKDEFEEAIHLKHVVLESKKQHAKEQARDDQIFDHVTAEMIRATARLARGDILVQILGLEPLQTILPITFPSDKSSGNVEPSDAQPSAASDVALPPQEVVVPPSTPDSSSTLLPTLEMPPFEDMPSSMKMLPSGEMPPTVEMIESDEDIQTPLPSPSFWDTTVLEDVLSGFLSMAV